MANIVAQEKDVNKTTTVTTNFVVFEANGVSTNDTIQVPSLSTISASVLRNKSGGASLTGTNSGNQVTLTQASQTNIDVLGIAWE